MTDTWRSSNNDEELRSWDRFVHARTVITSNHRMIHEGFLFDVSGIVASLAAGADFDILFKFPAGQFGHLTVVEYTLEDAPCTIEFYENTVTSADGTPLRISNHNRVVGDSNPSTAVITSGPTVTDVGDLVHERWVPDPGGSGVGQASGQLVAGEDDEWVLGHPTQATSYLWRLTNDTAGAIKLSYHFNGYQPGYID